MKSFKLMAIPALAFAMTLTACRNNDDAPKKNNVTPEKNNVTLHFDNVVGNQALELGKTYNSNNQDITFNEVKYIISNIALVKADGKEVPYNIDNLDKGATVINLADAKTFDYILTDIPAGNYKEIKLGLGVKKELNTLDEEKFPKFFKSTDKNNTKMHWEWGTGYRFTKIEGKYDNNTEDFSIHTGSTRKNNNIEDPFVPGVDAFREVTLSLPSNAIVGTKAPKITIKADFDKLLNGTNKITLLGNIPTVHNTNKMIPIVDNLGGDGKDNKTGMFSVGKVE